MKNRLPNFELLRIVSMFMVLVLHANFCGIGKPTAETALTAVGIAQISIQALSICAVNTFIMISGWFGIKPSIKGFCNFIWQVFYFVIIEYIIFFLVFHHHISIKDICGCFGLYNGGGWFVASYIGLYIIAPVLNSFLKNSSVQKITMTLIAFFAFELIWGNSLSVGFILGGYSTFSFIGIYLLAGLLRMRKLNITSKTSLTIFFVICILNSLFYLICTRLNLVAIIPMIFNYINPFVIAAASFLLLTFANLPEIQNRLIRKFTLWLGASCFAVYLFHVGTSYSSNVFFNTVHTLFHKFPSPLDYLVVLIFLIIVFLIAIILDQPRKFIWLYGIKPAIDKLICK